MLSIADVQFWSQEPLPEYFVFAGPGMAGVLRGSVEWVVRWMLDVGCWVLVAG